MCSGPPFAFDGFDVRPQNLVPGARIAMGPSAAPLQGLPAFARSLAEASSSSEIRRDRHLEHVLGQKGRLLDWPTPSSSSPGYRSEDSVIRIDVGHL